MLFNWFKGRRAQRKLFRFWNGQEWVSDDPLAIQIRLETHPTCRWDVHPALSEQGDAAAYNIVLDAICDCFNVKRFDPATRAGLTQIELMQLLAQFASYIDSLKKNTSGFLKPPSSSVATYSQSKPTTTSDTSDSVSTSTDAAIAQPTQSETELT